MALTTDQAVQLVNHAIIELDVGPETVQAFAPGALEVDWDTFPPPGARAKMLDVQCAVRGYLMAHLHQIPQVFLVAENGTVRSLFGLECGVTRTPVPFYPVPSASPGRGKSSAAGQVAADRAALTSGT